jgi:diguanylate cyclase (GGDEF)-like protein
VKFLQDSVPNADDPPDLEREGPLADDEKAFLRRLHNFTRALDGQVDLDGVLAATLIGARQLLRGRTSELWLKQASCWLHYVCTEDGLDVRTARYPDRLERLALSTGSGVVVPRRSRRFGRAHHPELEDRAADAIAVPLANPELEGALTVLDQLDPRTTFSAEDLKALTSMAAHAGAALHSALLLDRLAREAEEKEHQALHDSLTGLPNRMSFATEVEAILALRGGGDTPRSAAVMLLDLDSFKEVNDTLGHGVGDVVLKITASRLTAEIGDRGVVARLGGDEYAMIVPVEGREGAMREAEAVKRCVEEPIDEEGLLIEPRTSIGVAMSPEHGDDASTLLRLADVAMYSAKEHRSGITFYEARHDHYSPRRLTLAGELRRAIAGSELLVTYQPQQDLMTGAITAVEALLRWNHTVHGFVPPDEFIPVAEQTGLIVPLTDYVLTEALHQQNRWAHNGLHLEVAVNLSPRVVQDDQLPSSVAQRLAETAGDASRLILELTETAFVTDHARVAATLHQLAAMGVRISIDNFGTGYSSLSRLSDLPVDEVKIDRSFVLAMANGAPESVVRSMIDLGHSLDLRVVAEGVEDLGTLQRLRQLHCDAVQGFALSRAVAANVLEAWLADRDVGMPAERVIVPLRRGSGPPGEAGPTGVREPRRPEPTGPSEAASTRREEQEMTSEGRDALTGLLNLRSFQEILNKAVSDGRSFTLAVADIANFKRVNDRFGMRYANEVLRAVGRELRSFGVDTAARIGGDEFALIVDGADADLGAHLSVHLSTAANVRYVIGEISTTISTEVGDIAVAVGTATFPGDATGEAGLFEIADRRLSAFRERARRLQRVLEHQRQHPAPPPKPPTHRQFAKMVQTMLARFIDGTPLDEDSRRILIVASGCLAHLSEHGSSAWDGPDP